MRRTRASSWRSYQPTPAVRDLGQQTAAPSATVRVLGLDPGSLRTGYGLIEVTGAQVRHLDHGVIEVRGAEFPLRLRQIARAVERLVGALDADLALEVAVERAFMHRNADSALKLAQARGAALAALPEPARVFEYAPRAVKQSTVGFGAADKLQVASMVAQLLGLPPDAAQADAADALAVALCHAQTRRLGQLLAAHS